MPPQAPTPAVAEGGVSAKVGTAAAGFRYTPPSYLLKTRDENRPWGTTASGKDYEEVSADDLEDVAMRQEDRPIRRETQLDAHFQQRLQRKQNRYRNILKGEEEVVVSDSRSTTSSITGGDDSSFMLAMEQDVLAIASLHQHQQVQQAAANAQQAREARKQRLSGGTVVSSTGSLPKTKTDGLADPETVRTLRAQRLRSSLLQRTPDEIDVQHKLEVRRKAQQEADKLAKAKEAEQEAETKLSLELERKKLQEERDALEQAKREAAFQLARQWRISQQKQLSHNNSDTVRSHDSVETDDSLEEMLRTASSTANSRKSTKNTRGHKLSSARRRFKKKTSSTRRFTTFDDDTAAAAEFAFLDDFSQLLRESGFLQSCVGQCFGDQPIVPSSEDSISTGNPSMTEEQVKTAERMNLYAKYRE